jgi:hypothetical protein
MNAAGLQANRGSLRNGESSDWKERERAEQPDPDARMMGRRARRSCHTGALNWWSAAQNDMVVEKLIRRTSLTDVGFRKNGDVITPLNPE